MKADDLFERNDLTWLEGKPDHEIEGVEIERKIKFDDQVARAISAFSNGDAPSGLVVVGVDRTGKTVGVDPTHADHKMPEISQRLGTLPVGVIHKRIIVPDGGGKIVVIYRVPRSPQKLVRLSDGQAFRRVGDATHQLSDEEIRETRYLNGEARFELEPRVLFSRELLHAGLCERFQAALAEEAGGAGNTLETDLLNKQLAIKIGDEIHLTVAGVLLLAVHPEHFIPGAFVRYLRFEGLEEAEGPQKNSIQDRRFVGPLPLLLEEVDKFIDTQIPVRTDLVGERFENVPDFPHDAWLEAVTNAIGHRSYSLEDVEILVRQFADRFTVRSPGGFPPFVDEGDLIRGQSHSQRRNPVVMDGLRVLGAVKAYAEGHKRMRAAMLNRGLPPPEWHQDQPRRLFVTVTLRNDRAEIRDQFAARPPVDWERIARDLTDRDLAIVRERAIQEWQNAQRTGAKAPAVLIDTAFDLLGSGVSEREQQQIVQQLMEARLEKTTPAMERVISRVLSQPSDFAAPPRNQLASIISGLQPLVDRVARYMANAERSPQPEETMREAGNWASLVLLNRLGRSPLPDRETLVHWKELAYKWSKTPNGKQLFERIAGRSPT